MSQESTRIFENLAQEYDAWFNRHLPVYESEIRAGEENLSKIIIFSTKFTSYNLVKSVFIFSAFKECRMHNPLESPSQEGSSQWTPSQEYFIQLLQVDAAII